MNYSVVFSDKARDQLFDIIRYIRESAQDSRAAESVFSKITESVRSLEKFPDMGMIPRYAILKKQGYRVLIVDRYLIFYTKTERTVSIVSVVDGRQEYRNLV